uniref:Uncharacterized protein n=1 Tax=Arundo donax TaxID=35708 RepID=A0A0A9CF26_ARUDO
MVAAAAVVMPRARHGWIGRRSTYAASDQASKQLVA